MLALILAPKFPELDLGKCLQYALIHDLGELYAGDTYIYDQAWLADKARKEAESMEKLFALMPHDTHEQFEKLWHDYESRADIESQFIYELDKIHPIILIVSLETNAWSEYRITKERILGTKLAKLSDRFGFREMLIEYIEEADRKGLLHKEEQ